MSTLTAATLPEPPLVDLPLRQVLHHVRHYHTGLEVFRDQFGPVSRIRIAPRVLPPFAFVTSPQGMHDVLTASGEDVDKKTVFHKQTWLWGWNVFNMVHEDWVPRRRILQPVFTKKHVESFTGHMAKSADEVAAEWADAGRISLNSATRSLTLRVLGRSLFGLELQHDAPVLEQAVEDQLFYITKRGTAPVRAPVWLPTPQRARFRRNVAVVKEIAERGLRVAEAGGDAELVQKLRDARDPETGAQLSRQAIIDELNVFLLAGHDTTATTLAYTLWQLGRHHELQDQVAAEVADLDLSAVTDAVMKTLPTTMKVLHESLRLCPPAAAIGRSATRDIEVDGFRLAAGTQIFLGLYALHRDPAIWGADAAEFRPDRFDEPEGGHKNRWAFLPFGGGHRSCIGDHFAMIEAVIALAALVQRLRFTSVEEEFPLALPFTMTAGGPIPAHVERR
ncbi:MAG TPA: cytochrome P450 [Nocardioidaceae bacterium]|nr:cytochrome P450 [Nocardioidaceae bacterium]